MRCHFGAAVDLILGWRFPLTREFRREWFQYGTIAATWTAEAEELR